ncbi:hypothetical protein ABVT39_020027 [Epinephelus coioides]
MIAFEMPKKMPSFQRSVLSGAMPILGSVPDASRPRGNHRNVPPDPESAPNRNSNQLIQKFVVFLRLFKSVVLQEVSPATEEII